MPWRGPCLAMSMAQISLPPSVRARSRLVAQVALITGFSLTVAGCANDKDRKTDESGGFISHVPGGSRGGDGLDGGASGGDGDLAVGDENAGDGDGDRVISEADIIKLDGNRLYALSQFSGLSI